MSRTNLLPARKAPDTTRRLPDVGPLRLWVCVAAVVGSLPYLLLKIAWVAGLALGVSDPEFLDTSRAANLMTLSLELVAIAVAVLLVAPWGRRVPAFALTFPAWVAAGLLTPVALGAVLGAPVQVIAGQGNPFEGDPVLSPWVFALVYGGFVAQAVFLSLGFVLHARSRWPLVTRGGRLDDATATTTRPLQDLLGGIFVLAAVAHALLHLMWAVSGGGRFDSPTLTQRVYLVATASLALAGAWAFLGLLRGARLTQVRLACAWVGSAVVFTGALLLTLTTVAVEADGWGASQLTAAEAMVTLLVLLGSLAGSVGGAVRLVEEQAAPAA